MRGKMSQPSDVWRHVDQRGPDECWEWTASRFPNGYGQLGYQHQKWYPHRLIYTFVYGEIPDGLLVCHACDNRLCCNPSHLWLGTHKDNTQDAVAKGRMAAGDRQGGRLHPEHVPRGKNHWNAKLTESDVRDIRRSVAEGMTRREVARLFGVSPVTIGDIISGKSWRSLQAEQPHEPSADDR